MNMPKSRPAYSLLVMLAVLVSALAGALPAEAQDKNAERAQRRTQLQMQGLQQQLQEAQAAKAKIEADQAGLTKKQGQDAAALARASSAERKLSGDLKAALAERETLTARVAEMERQLADQRKGSDELLGIKDRELAQGVQQLQQRDNEQLQLQARFAGQVQMVTQCTDKNQRLARLNADLIAEYRKKYRSDPVLGLGDVQMFNFVQDARDRADAERFTPFTSR